LALAPGTLERAIFPPKRMDIGVAGIDVEELVEMGVHRPDGESPLVTKSTLERIRRFSLFMTRYSSTNSDKLSDKLFLLPRSDNCSSRKRDIGIGPAAHRHPAGDDPPRGH
jgi:hypothetical protein